MPSTTPSPSPKGLQLWWLAIRPKTLGLAISPVLVGTALAWVNAVPEAHFEAMVVIIICAVAIQAGTNLFNDKQDFINGTDNTERQGPPRITAMGWALPHQVSIAGLSAFLIALLGGYYLVLLGGWWIFFLGLGALWAGYLYSHGPYPISHSPFGELVVIAFFGIFAVAGTAYLINNTVADITLTWGVIMGLPGGAVLLLNNLRDRQGDQVAGRRTLAILLGLTPTRWLYALLILGPFVMAVGTVVAGLTPFGALMCLFALPMALRCTRAVFLTPPDVSLNPLLGATVKLQGLLAVCASAGMIIEHAFTLNA